MVLSECRQLMAENAIVEARLVHDYLSAGWGVNFIDNQGNEYPDNGYLRDPM